MVAPMTSSPGPLSTGIDSPVSIDWSRLEAPSVTMPSTGTFSPGRTRTRSPTWTCSIGRSSLHVPTDDPRRPGLEPDQRADGAGGLTLGAGLHPAAEEHEPDDDGARVEVRFGLATGLHEHLRPERDHRAVAPSSSRADGDQRVHRHIAVAASLSRPRAGCGRRPRTARRSPAAAPGDWPSPCRTGGSART